MHITLKMIEKLDNLLDETDEYIKCATTHSDDSDLKSAYIDLARCHYEGYEKLIKCCERAVDKKSEHMQEGHFIKQMADWHIDKFNKRAVEIKIRLDQLR